MQAAQQSSLPITDARVITNALLPQNKSHPKPLIVLALGLAGGLGAGAGLGLLRELLNRTIRNKRQLERAAGVPCLALLPKIRTGTNRQRGAERKAGPREVLPRRMEFTSVLRAPFSQFAEGIRSIKLSSDLNLAGGDGGVVVGIVSSLPGEGKSTVAANLAFLAAQTGARTLLIDCDMRNPSLTQGLTPKVDSGLRGLLDGLHADMDEIVCVHVGSGIHFLPASLNAIPDNTSGLLNSAAMERLLKTARARYDVIVGDFAPMLPVVDVRAMAHLVDGFVLVAEWSRTPIDAVAEAVALSTAARNRLLGTVLNKVDMKLMRRYGEYDGQYYAQYFER
jgi:succinoglycan biosynthesis transport protein ExoP